MLEFVFYNNNNVTQYESSYNTGATNHNTNGSIDYGIFQVTDRMESSSWPRTLPLLGRSMMTSGATPVSATGRTVGWPATGHYMLCQKMALFAMIKCCHVSLLDSNLDDDCSCAKIIWNRHGFEAWWHLCCEMMWLRLLILVCTGTAGSTIARAPTSSPGSVIASEYRVVNWGRLKFEL